LKPSWQLAGKRLEVVLKLFKAIERNPKSREVLPSARDKDLPAGSVVGIISK
jgi:hypothetical protein